MKRWVLDRPVSLALAVVTLVVTLATGSFPWPGPTDRAQLGLGVDSLFGAGHLFALATSVLVAGGPIELLAVVVALMLGVGACERRLGSARVALAWGTTALLGGLGGTALQALGLLARGVWSTPPSGLEVLHPLTPIVGVAMAASAFAGPLWRRRIRTIGFSALIVLLLYSGQPGDLNRLVGALGGLGLGNLLARSVPRLVWVRSSHQEARSVLAVVVALSAVGPVVAVLQPRGFGLLRPLGRLFRDPLPTSALIERCGTGTGAECTRAELLAQLNGPGALLMTVLPLLVLLVAAVGIQRGRRAAAWLAAGTAALLGVFAGLYYDVLPLLQDPDQIVDQRASVTLQTGLAVLVPLAIAVLAVSAVRHCPVLPTRRALSVGVAAGGGAVVLACLLYVVGGALVGRQFSPAIGVPDLLAQLPEKFVPVGFLRFRRIAFVPQGPVAVLLEGWTGVLGWGVLLIAAVAVVASARRVATGSEAVRIRQLLHVGALGSISWMCTWPGNRYWFSADGRHGVAYRDVAGVALTLGAPVGPPDGAAAAAREFALHCDTSGLVPAFYAVPAPFAEALGAGGPRWAEVEVGQDTVIDPSGFTMRGKHWQDVRSSINRADRLGIRAVWTTWSALRLGDRTQIDAISEEWVAEKRLPELGFTLGGTAELVDPDVALMLAVGPDDRIEAVTSWLPTWRDGELCGWTLDFMRRRDGSPNGIMEFLIAGVIEAAQQRGLEFVSLSVAPLDLGTADPDRLERLMMRLARVLEPAYGFHSLAGFKQKFRPHKVPQVLAFPDAVALPAITVAIARAYLLDPAAGKRSRIEAPLPEAEPSEVR